MKLNWNFQRGGGLIGKIPFVGGMDIFWNHTMTNCSVVSHSGTFSFEEHHSDLINVSEQEGHVICLIYGHLI